MLRKEVVYRLRLAFRGLARPRPKLAARFLRLGRGCAGEAVIAAALAGGCPLAAQAERIVRLAWWIVRIVKRIDGVFELVPAILRGRGHLVPCTGSALRLGAEHVPAAAGGGAVTVAAHPRID